VVDARFVLGEHHHQPNLTRRWAVPAPGCRSARAPEPQPPAGGSGLTVGGRSVVPGPVRVDGVFVLGEHHHQPNLTRRWALPAPGCRSARAPEPQPPAQASGLTVGVTRPWTFGRVDGRFVLGEHHRNLATCWALPAATRREPCAPPSPPAQFENMELRILRCGRSRGRSPTAATTVVSVRRHRLRTGPGPASGRRFGASSNGPCRCRCVPASLGQDRLGRKIFRVGCSGGVAGAACPNVATVPHRTSGHRGRCPSPRHRLGLSGDATRRSSDAGPEKNGVPPEPTRTIRKQ
jgi:hypothetical protein